MPRIRYVPPLFFVFLLFLVWAETASCAMTMEHAVPTSPEQRRKANDIIQENKPKLVLLSQQIRQKVTELRRFEYDSTTEPAVLIRLGRELQALRDALRHEILNLDTKLRRETGVSLRLHKSRGCAGLTRFTPPSETSPTPSKEQTGE